MIVLSSNFNPIDSGITSPELVPPEGERGPAWGGGGAVRVPKNFKKKQKGYKFILKVLTRSLPYVILLLTNNKEDTLMVLNNFELETKIKCLEEGLNQTTLAEKIDTTGQYINRLIKKETIVNRVFVKMMEALGYDILVTYVKREQ